MPESPLHEIVTLCGLIRQSYCTAVSEWKAACEYLANLRGSSDYEEKRARHKGETWSEIRLARDYCAPQLCQHYSCELGRLGTLVSAHLPDTYISLRHVRSHPDNYQRFEVWDELDVELARIENAARERAPTSGLRDWQNLGSYSDRKRSILSELLAANAVTVDARLTGPQIAARVDGPQANPDGFKHPLAQLKKDGYLEVHPQGGYWLSKRGLAAAKAGCQEVRTTATP